MSDGLRRIQEEGALSQLLSRSGRIADLGSEGGELKLDWVDGVARLLEDEDGLRRIEVEAERIWEQGIRHVIWSGMGGSIMAVRVMKDMGLFGVGLQSMFIHPLDSTDPAALNEVLRALGFAGDEASLRDPLAGVMMIAVAMGMTSEEPITHLEWFIGLLEQAGLAPDRHCLVMALPDSYLDRFAQERGLPSRPLQVDEGTGTGGRMSAPTTRVFLLPAAFALRATGSGLADVLRAAWAEHALSSAVEAPAENPYVTLAAAMSDASIDGVCRLFVDARGGWEALLPWIEQLMEESLGKGGKGLLVFGPDRRNPDGRFFQADPSIQVQLGPGLARSGRTNRGGGLDNQMFISTPISGTATPGGPPFVGNDPSVFPPERPSSRLHPADTLLSALATAFLGWQLTMALYGYLQDIQFAGQPAVEDYKTRARRLRELDHPLREVTESASAVRSGRLIMLQPPGDEGGGETPSEMIATRIASTCPSYLDITINGECPLDLVERMRDEVQQLGERVLGVPVKVRRAPAAYHSTEQSEMDGPTGVFSIRLLTTHSEVPVLGEYEMGFLTAQAVATWQAMTEVGRDCYLLVWEGTARQAAVPAPSLLSEVSRLLL